MFSLSRIARLAESKLQESEERSSHQQLAEDVPLPIPHTLNGPPRSRCILPQWTSTTSTTGVRYCTLFAAPGTSDMLGWRVSGGTTI